MKRHPKFIDMAGQTVGCLTVLREADPPLREDGSVNGAAWVCLCAQCGETTIIEGFALRYKGRKWLRCSACPSRRRSGGEARRLESDGPNVPSTISIKRLSYEPKRAPVKLCKLCCGLPWQRPSWGCAGCDQPYAAEVIEPFERRRFSAIALCEVAI